MGNFPCISSPWLKVDRAFRRGVTYADNGHFPGEASADVAPLLANALHVS